MKDSGALFGKSIISDTEDGAARGQRRLDGVTELRLFGRADVTKSANTGKVRPIDSWPVSHVALSAHDLSEGSSRWFPQICTRNGWFEEMEDAAECGRSKFTMAWERSKDHEGGKARA